MATLIRKQEELHDILIKIPGIKRCYFSPPSGTGGINVPDYSTGETDIIMEYPCIFYELSGIDTDRADNINYRASKRYTLTLVDTEPDNKIVDLILELPYCSFDRQFISDDLCHFVYTLYF